MSGRVIQVCAITPFDFSTVTGNASSLSQTIARQVDVSQWRQATLAVRVFSKDIQQQNAVIAVEAYNDGLTDEDPTAVDWTTTACASIVVGQGTTGYEYLLADLDDYPVGDKLAIVVTGVQDTAADTLSATLSVDLVLKD